MSSNQKKDKTLGMPHGTANSRLKKNILFFLLKKHGENACIRCNQEIESVDDLSIEHIKPWEGISAELFWDLQNIAFSHLHCNRPHRYVPENLGKLSKPMIGEKGTAWCNVCRKFEPVENFHKNVTHWNGLQKHCKQHRPDR